MTPSKTAPNKLHQAKKKAARKDEIIKHAAICFMQQGYHATTIDDVARRMGNTKGQIYHYYNSKTDLFFDVHRVGMAHLFYALEHALSSKRENATGAEVLETMLLAHANAMLEFHTYENVVAQGVQIHRFGATTPAQRRTVRTLMDDRDQFEGHFKSQVKEGIRDGSLCKTDISITTKMLLGALQWSIFWYRPKPGETTKSRHALAIKMVAPLLHGLLVK